MKIKKIFLIVFALAVTVVTYGQTQTYSIKSVPFTSNKSDEFSPVYYKNGIVFCSNRSWNLVKNYQTSENKGLLKINFVDTLTWKPKLFSRSLSTRFNDGPASFSRKGDTIYFSRNLMVDGAADQEISPRNKLGVFTAVKENDDWVKVLDLRFNNEYYNITTPYISPDGKRLFFASDNPAGLGGTDLYYCNWKGDYWDEPVNLGPGVNTSGNESYPTVDREGGVFFASDGHPGLGGKDVFYTKEVKGKWITPVHLDAPVNSKYDDFALVADSVMGRGFFSSKRGSSVDIYSFKTNIRQLFYCEDERVNQYCFKFTDENKIPVDTRYLKLVWSFGDGTTAEGLGAEHCYEGPGDYKVRLDAVDKKSGRIVFSKMSFDLELRDIEQPIIISPESGIKGQPIIMDAMSSNFPGSEILDYTWYFGDGERARGQRLTHIYMSEGEYDVKLGLTVRNPETGVIRQACAVQPVFIFADQAAKAGFDSRIRKPVPVVDIFEYDQAKTANLFSAEKNISQDAVYRVEIARSKVKLTPGDEIFRRLPVKYFVKEQFITEEKLYSYTINEEMSLMAAYPCYNEIAGLGYENARIVTHLLTDPASIELNNMKRVFGVSADQFFRPNTFTLSTQGTQLLDLFLGYMSKYPSLKLEISCHTDNQGQAAQNQSLSQKRAEAMVNYLAINGVSRNRIIPRGYGGTRPVAPNYQESDRKLNRRIDFRILE